MDWKHQSDLIPTIIFKKKNIQARWLAYNPSWWKVKARGLSVRGQPGIHTEYKASLNHIVKLSQKITGFSACK
jgi:hypothetical protein